MNLSDQIRDMVRGCEIQIEELKKALVDECGKTLRLESQLEEAETLITQTSHGAAERIAELEAQIAAASAPVVEQKPVAWLSECIKAGRKGYFEISEPNEKATNPEYWTDAFPVYKALQAPVREVPEPEGWREAMQEFVDRCERGEILSRYTYSKFKALLTPLPADPVQQEPKP